MLACVLVVRENAESRVFKKLGLHRKCHKHTIALPFTNAGNEVGGQSSWKKKADVLLVVVLDWYHGERTEMPMIKSIRNSTAGLYPKMMGDERRP